MERVSNKWFEDFPATTLYLDELAEVVEVFRGACKRIEVKAGQFTITDHLELSALASKFPEGRFPGIQIQGYEPNVSVNFQTYAISAYVSEDSLEQLGIIAKMRTVIAVGKRRRLDLLLNIPIWPISGFGVWQLLSKEYVLGVALIGFSLATIPIMVRFAMRNNVVIHSRKRGEFKSFLQRKKDDIVLAVIAALLGGVVTYIITTFAP